jgi:threonine dehydratase
MALVTIADIRAAERRIAGAAVRTPLLPCPWAGEKRPLWLKPESLQPVGAFKIRGAVNKIASLTPAERAAGVVTHSSGNHAQAVAYAARLFGIPSVIVIPERAPAVKVAATRAFGARVEFVPAAERERRVAELVAEHGYTPVPPYDDALVIAGQGTVGLEIAADLPGVELVLVPISGGGLISGVATAVKALRPRVRVVGVEPELAADALESWRTGRRVAWAADQTQRTMADGLRVTCVGELPWQHIRARVDDIVTVSEEEIGEAMRVLAGRARLVAEPSGAVATAAYLFRDVVPPDARTVCIVSGGNVDPDTYAAILSRGRRA